MEINLKLCVSTMLYEVMKADFHESNSALDIAVFGVFTLVETQPQIKLSV